MASTSNSYAFQPDIATLVALAYSRIQIRGPQITNDHLIDARVVMNLLFSDWSANRGVNLAQVDQISFGMVAGLATYTLPANTVDLLDCYIRTYTASTTTTNLGSAQTAVVDQAGAPMVNQTYGDPLVVQPGSGVLSSVAGSDLITMRWPAHGLIQGSPIFFGTPIFVGGVSVPALEVVSNVVDGNFVQFVIPVPALETQSNDGSPPLLYAQNGSSTLTVIQPGHGLQPGGTFNPGISTAVGGLTISGNYTVVAVQSLSQFTINAGSNATSTATAFVNGGLINAATQASGVAYSDNSMFPLSRNDYAGLANKFVPGRPSSYWVNRIVPPQINLYPVADSTQSWGFVAYRMRQIQDAIPAGGQIPDLPRRMWPAFVAQLTADLAEIWKPEMWAEKLAEAEKSWLRAASADVERATLHIVPQLGAYYR